MKPEKAASLKLKFLCVILLLAVPTLARADSGWVLKQSTLTYHVTHPLHEVAGVGPPGRPPCAREKSRPSRVVTSPTWWGLVRRL